MSYLAQLGMLRASTIIDNQESLNKGGNPIDQSHGSTPTPAARATDQGESPVHKKSPQRIETGRQRPGLSERGQQLWPSHGKGEIANKANRVPGGPGNLPW